MKSGLSWNLRGVDEGTREAVIEAARRSGLTVGQWLNTVLAEEGIEHGEPEDIPAATAEAPPEDPTTRDAAQLAEAIEGVTRRLGQLDQAARAAIPDLRERLDAVERHVAVLSDEGLAAEAQRALLSDVSALIDSLAADIAAAAGEPMADEASDEPAAEAEDDPDYALDPMAPTIDVDKINLAIAELDGRIAEMGAKITNPPPLPDPRPLKLDNIRMRLDALLEQAPMATARPAQSMAIETALQALESRIDNAKAQLEARVAARDAEAQAQAQAETNEQIGRIETRLAEIAERIAAAEEARQKPKKDAVLSTAIREISAHQRAIDDRAETAAMRRDQKTLAAAMAALRNELAALGEQVGRIGAEEHGAVFELSRRVEAMAAEKPLDREILNGIRADLGAMREMVETRHEDMSTRLGGLVEMTPDREKLEGLGDELAALRQTLEADDSPRAIAQLDARVAELGDLIETTVAGLQKRLDQPNAAVTRLEGRLDAIASHIESLKNSTALSSAEERLQGRMDEIANRLGGLFVSAAKPQTAAIEQVEKKLGGRMAEISTRLNNFADARLQTEAIEKAQRQLEIRLEGIVERLGTMFATNTQDAALSHVHERLQAITERIETLSASQREPSTALDAIKSEIKSLRAEISEKEVPQVDTEQLETQIRSLAEQLTTVSGSSKSEAKALADLEAQVAHLASELEMNQPHSGALHQVEERLDRLQAMLTDTANESIQNARVEARKAVDDLAQMVAGNEVDAGTVRGLMRDLDSLRNATAGTDDATRSKLESVSETMTQVVARLSRLEEETKDADRAQVTGTYGGAPAVAKLDASELLWKSGFRPAKDDAEPAPAETPEPAAPAAAAPAPVKTTAPASKKPTEQRADFIAAARRAAQAAAQEAAAIEATIRQVPDVVPEQAATPGERKPGAFARISEAIRSRKRPLLLAAAAIVLAIGAMQLYGKVAPGIGESTAVVAKVDTAPDPLPPVRVVTPAGADVDATTTASLVAAPDPAAVAVSTAAAATAPDAGAAPLAAVTPDAAIAFAPPMITDSTFGTPAADAASAAADASTDVAANAPDAATTSPDAATPPTGGAAPMVLASAPTPGGDTSALDSRLGSPKLLSAATGGDATAAFEIATRYAEGTRVPKDLAKAAAWYAKAAEGGIAVAQYRLGSFFERGQGVDKDLVKAVNWYQRAADQGNVNAMHNLAVLMSEGVEGQQPDHDKALQWFLAAANYGVRDSQYNLGVIYARGLGTAQDLAQSYKWFAIAARQGDTDAAARRDEVAKVMSADDLARARATVSAWKAKPSLAEANSVATPAGGWDANGDTITTADREALVKKIQTLLADAGYDPGPADGVAGPKTFEAVRAYQRETGMPETGAIDHNLVVALTDGQ